MDPDDNEELLRLLALAITRLEDATADEARPLLFELALRIRQLLLTLPPGSVARSLQWSRIRGQIALLIMQLNDALAQLFWSRLIAADAEVVRILNELYGPRPPLQPRPTSRVLDTTRVLTTPVSDLFAVSPTGMSPFSIQLLRLLERSVGSSILNDDPTEAVAAKVLTTRTRGGAQIPYIARGTIANAWIERFRSLIAAALWSTIAPNQLRAAALVPAPPQLWRWNAILDPRTCPICRPLHNTTAPSPEAFPNGAPPLHPRCRCIVLPA